MLHRQNISEEGLITILKPTKPNHYLQQQTALVGLYLLTLPTPISWADLYLSTIYSSLH